MTAIIQNIVRLVIIVLVLAGAGLVLKNNLKTPEVVEQTYSPKATALKNYLKKSAAPQRIEIFGLSERFANEINDIKKLKIAQDKNSDFYVTVQLFSDENDLSAPLIAQIRFIDIKSGNLKNEESINLE